MIRRGQIYWTDLGPPRGSAPAKVRPVVVIQDDEFNDSRLATTIAAVITSNTQLAELPGNVFLSAGTGGLGRDSVVNVTALVTVDRSHLEDYIGLLPLDVMDEVKRGLELVLSLDL